MVSQHVVVRHTFFDLVDTKHHDERPVRAASDSGIFGNDKGSAKDEEGLDARSVECYSTFSDEETDMPSSFPSFASSSDVSTPPRKCSIVPPPGCFNKPAGDGGGAPMQQPMMWIPAGSVSRVPAQVAFFAIPAAGPTICSAASAQERRSRNHARRQVGQRGATVRATPGVSSACQTTVMLRNIPNNYSRALLIELLDSESFNGLYDFLYLPFDFQTQACLGYAFLNLIDVTAVERFWRTFDWYSNRAIPSWKQIRVSWSSAKQGLDANVERYRNSPVMAESIPDEYKPAMFVDGARVPFPLPTKTAQAKR